MHWGFCQGISNNFADWLSHIGHLLQDKASEVSRRKAVKLLEVSEATATANEEYPTPAGWRIKDSTFDFSLEQWRLVSETTAVDQTPFHKLTVGDVFAVMTGSKETPRLIQERVQSWKSKIFAISPMGSETPCLFVPQTFSRSESAVFECDDKLADIIDMSTAEDHQNLVLLIPAELNLQVSCVLSCIPP